MVNFCALKSCPNSSKKNKDQQDQNQVHYFKFPSDEPFRTKWREFYGLSEDKNLKWRSLCSSHFAPECIEFARGTYVVKSKSLPISETCNPNIFDSMTYFTH